jgi:pre-60S factor REI1
MAKCISCGLSFDEGVIRDHYRSDFHRYNLKRTAAGLPPVDQSLFETRRKAAEAAIASKAAAEAAEPTHFRCEITGKVFKTRAQFEQHLKSKKFQLAKAKHEEGLAKKASASAEETVRPPPVEPDWESMTVFTHCMFDNEPVDGLEA